MHPTLGFRRPLTEGDCEKAAGLQKINQFPKCSGPVGGCHVHPHRAEKDEVERKARPEGEFQIRQGVGHPPDLRAIMTTLPNRAHPGRGFHGHDVIPQIRKPRRIAAATGADIENRRRTRW